MAGLNQVQMLELARACMALLHGQSFAGRQVLRA